MQLFSCVYASVRLTIARHWNSGQPKLAESQKPLKMQTPKDEDNEEVEEEHENTLCGACGDNYANDEFWICCDLCEKWFHGKCVRITPAKAEHIKQYKCPSCSSHKRARPWSNLKLDDRFISENTKKISLQFVFDTPKMSNLEACI